MLWPSNAAHICVFFILITFESSYCFSVVKSYVDRAIADIESAKKMGNDDPDKDNNFLYKLLRKDPQIATMMLFDMLFAGIDTVFMFK